MEAAPADTLNPDWGGPGSKVLTYRYLDLLPHDKRGLIGYLKRAFTECAHASPMTDVAGLVAWKGATPSVADPKLKVECVLLVSDRRVGWVLFDGSGWKSADRTRALQVVGNFTAATP